MSAHPVGSNIIIITETRISLEVTVAVTPTTAVCSHVLMNDEH